jgi:hypothetical protein
MSAVNVFPNSAKPNPEQLISRLNLLWVQLLRACKKKERLPLAGFDAPLYFISADWEHQKAELRNHFAKWRGKLTRENLAALDVARAEIAGLRKQLNGLLSRLSLAGFTIASLDDLTPELRDIKARKLLLVKQKKFEELARLRFEEEARLAAITEHFAEDDPVRHFKTSWYKEKELIFLPSGNHESRALLKRLSTEAYKSN